MPELGETADPRLLVPGDPESARAVARSMIALAGNLSEAGDGLARVGTPEGWSGEAADAFRGRFATQPPAWQGAGDAFTVASRALDIYAETLEWAQRQAGEAARVFSEAQRATSALAQVDPGEAGGTQAHDMLNQARGQVAVAGEDAARVLDEAASGAPSSTSFWGDVGEVLADLGEGAVDIGRDAVNAAASLGNAAINHPADVAAMAAGAGMMLLGGSGALGGGALSVTGVGAPAGVPLTAASAGLIAAGAGLAGAGAISMAVNAAGEDKVAPAGSAGGGGPVAPPYRTAAARPRMGDQKLRNIVDDLYQDDPTSRVHIGNGTTGDAVRYERATGNMVGNKRHVQKANNAVRALRNWLRKNPNASPEDRGIAQNEMNNLLDALGRTY